MIVAKNTGNATLTGVALADPAFGIIGLTYAWPVTAGTFDPGQTVTAPARHILTQPDVDSGSYVNVVNGTGTPPISAAATATASSTAPVSATAGSAVTKSGALAVAGANGVGKTVDYSFTVTNTGDTTVTGVSIADALLGVGALRYPWPTTTGARCSRDRRPRPFRPPQPRRRSPPPRPETSQPAPAPAAVSSGTTS